jgi:hypothetical protein
MSSSGNPIPVGAADLDPRAQSCVLQRLLSRTEPVTRSPPEASAEMLGAAPPRPSRYRRAPRRRCQRGTPPLPYFTVADLAAALERVRELGGSIVHPGDRWAVCRDSEGSPFALAAAPPPGE